MEMHNAFMSWENLYCKNAHITQSNTQIQYIPIKSQMTFSQKYSITKMPKQLWGKKTKPSSILLPDFKTLWNDHNQNIIVLA